MASYVLRQAKQQYPEQLLELGICPFDIISVFLWDRSNYSKMHVLGCGGISTGRVCCQRATQPSLLSPGVTAHLWISGVLAVF